MSLSLSRPAKINIAVVSGVISCVLGLMAWSIGRDFVQRGCNHIPSEEWIYTANCIDAYNFGVFAGGLAGLSLAAFGWSLWRLRNV